MATDVNTLILTAKNVLHEVATHALNLGLGLQNAAPAPQESKRPSDSVQYLLETFRQLEQTSQLIGALISTRSTPEKF